MSHFAYLLDRLLGPGAVERSTVDRTPSGVEHRLDATLSYGRVPVDVRGVVGGVDDDAYHFELECRDGTITIDDWNVVTGIAVTEPDESPVAAFAALLDGEPRDMADFPAAARVVEVIEALLA